MKKRRAPIKFVRINYIVGRWNSVLKTTVIQRGKTKVAGPAGTDDFHKRLRASIKRQNPGWAIAGWAVLK